MTAAPNSRNWGGGTGEGGWEGGDRECIPAFQVMCKGKDSCREARRAWWGWAVVETCRRQPEAEQQY